LLPARECLVPVRVRNAPPQRALRPNVRADLAPVVLVRRPVRVARGQIRA
jgi:hypothetical protein